MPVWLRVLPLGPIWLVLIGLCLGSFLNVVIHRLPRGVSLWPRSRCPHCGHAISPRDNIPLLGYLLLRGRCRHCHAPISPRYPVVELLGGASVLGAGLVSPDPLAAALRGLFLLAMIAIMFVDREAGIIPDEITLPGVVLGLVGAPLLGVPRLGALIGAAGGAAALLLIAWGYRAARRREGMGMGDVKLAGMVGAFLGWQGVLLTLILGSLAGSVYGLALVLSGRGSGRTVLPYGAFLAPAAALVLFSGSRLWAWFLGL